MRQPSSVVKKMFQKQGWHALLLVLLLLAVTRVSQENGFLTGSYWGIPTSTWFWLSIAFPIAHQIFVWLCWRLELHAGRLTGWFGPNGFRLYATGFALLAVGRLFTLTILALANRNTLAVNQSVLNIVAIVATILVGYTMYSVKHYFSFNRALGIDHFDPSYRTKPLVRQGIFRFTRNGMYTFGLLVVWLPGLLAASRAALLAALFSHLFIWVHYFCTELPDMRRIYGLSAGTHRSPPRSKT